MEKRPRLDVFRDNFARYVCNFMLRFVATNWYEKRVNTLIRYGVDSTIEDSVSHREPAPISRFTPEGNPQQFIDNTWVDCDKNY